ncbi:MBL fold metallo-hydrolase [Gramella jeungdoensis]|uniref:MBL fold metallo-hydrolase n=1 Tax=Gramella jeungdoensis TaxID=708091 RepID=A0ABT0YX88_9FLAO|nr:MBL fold metallo-hydrolase [Gramella jeungdoensis]MCM8568069.1 MBL fold metallo-hydrolase [Gramella jeungdoensis]
MKNITTTLFLLLLTCYPLFAFQNFDDVEIEIVPVNNNVYMLKGAGGNIGILTGEDGVFMIDDQFAPLSQKIIDKLKTISDQPVKFLVNTHHHGDHVGGNANFREEGALIFAHENVRKRLIKNEEISSGLPVVTFDHTINLHINGNDIVVAHVHNAHTDGDALIYFPQSNVLHTGDTFFNGRFPYIDLESGGTVKGDIEAARTGLSLINQNTRIIPGHGNIATYSEYEQYMKMLEEIRDNIAKAISEGKSEEDIVGNESLTSKFYSDEEMKDSFISGPKIRKTFYNDLKNQPRE